MMHRLNWERQQLPLSMAEAVQARWSHRLNPNFSPKALSRYTKRRNSIRVLFISGIILLSSLMVASAPAQSAETPLKIGVASMITPVDAVKYYQAIIDYIGEQIHQPVQMVHRRTYDEMDSLLEQGQVNVAFICSAPYVKNRAKFGVELLAAPSVGGKAIYRGYIIVHKDSPIKTFEQLKGKVFAFTDPKSNTGKLYPTYLLKTMKSTPERYFKRHMYSYSHNKSIELVAKKIVDGAAVESLVYGYMLKTGSPYANQTRIIKKSPPYGTPPVVVTTELDAVFREKIRDALLNMHKTEKGKAILDAMPSATLRSSGRKISSTARLNGRASCSERPLRFLS